MLASEIVYMTLEDEFSGAVYPAPRDDSITSVVPYVAYQNISLMPENTIDGFTGHSFVRMQINVYDYDSINVEKLAFKIVKLMQNQALATCEFISISDSSRDATKLYGKMIDFYISQCVGA